MQIKIALSLEKKGCVKKKPSHHVLHISESVLRKSDPQKNFKNFLTLLMKTKFLKNHQKIMIFSEKKIDEIF